MRQKELRIALVCYGGISLAVYMHGVTKELWKVLRASREDWARSESLQGSEGVYAALLTELAEEHGLHLRVLTDILAGTSAGGINSLMLGQAIHSGDSIEPLTELWLAHADVDVLLDPGARPWGGVSKFWAEPLVQFLLKRPGNAISETVAPETRTEVRQKLSRLIRSRWFEPPFSGIGFSRLLAEALEAMRESPGGEPLLPPGHPLDVFVTATDFKGHLEHLRLNSPPEVLEAEHRLTIGFRKRVPAASGHELAPLPELVLAGRSTASFPGAFPPLQLGEIDRLVEERGLDWPTRERFLQRIVPEHHRRGDLDTLALIDGAVLVNAPFADAFSVLKNRPAHREVDRRFVFIDPTPDRIGPVSRQDSSPPTWLSVIFGSLSSIPREQPIRDNLEAIENTSREMATLRSIIDALRPEVEEVVEKLFGGTLFFDHPTAKRLASWRAKAQAAASKQSGYAYHGYSQLKFVGLTNALAGLIQRAAPNLGAEKRETIAAALSAHWAAHGLDRMSALRGGASPQAIELFRTHDLTFRIRRLRLLARRVTEEREADEETTETDRDDARAAIYAALALYLEREDAEWFGADFEAVAARVFEEPGAVLAHVAERRALMETDARVDEILAEAMARMPLTLKRRMLLSYLGFPFYDAVTLPLLRGESPNEFEPAKVDRISPEDSHTLRPGGALGTLRGSEFYYFGAFFSRAYRENDYLWGRLHGAERMVDIIASTLAPEKPMPPERIRHYKRAAFEAILDEEETRLTCDPNLIKNLRGELREAG